MAKNNPVYNKAFSFAISIVNLYKHLTSERKNMCCQAIAEVRYKHRRQC